MKRACLLLLVVLLVLSSLIWSRSREIHPPLPSTVLTRASPGNGSQKSSKSSPPAIEAGEVNFPPSNPPSAERLRSEIAENPESTPASLLAFAKLLGAELAKGITSENGARAHLNRLRACLASDDVAPAAQVLCLRHAEILAARYPALAPEAEKIADEAPERAREIAAAMEPLN